MTKDFFTEIGFSEMEAEAMRDSIKKLNFDLLQWKIEREETWLKNLISETKLRLRGVLK